MPNTPVSWSINDFFANTNPNGTQSDPVITQLANGNVLITWTDADNSGVGLFPGTDVIGRIFDPLGNAVTGEIQLNVFFNVDNEEDPEIVALANGGFMVVYESDGPENDLAYETYNAAGVRQNGGFVLNDAAGGAVPNSPVVASATATSAMTAYMVNNADGSESVFARSYNPGANTFGAAGLVFSGSLGVGEDVGGIGLAALTNGNFALVIANRNGGNDDLELLVLNSAGTQVFSNFVNTAGEVSDLQITALTGGGFVAAWSNLTSGGVDMAVYSSTAGVVTNPIQVAGVNRNEPAVAALRDGSFVIVYDDDQNGGIRGQRYFSGTAIGSEFIIAGAVTASEPNVTGLADGRFQVTWNQASDIRSEIFDPRDFVNDPGVYGPDRWQVGTVNADVFVPNPFAGIVHGWDGNDVITEGPLGPAHQIFGDNGDDTVNVSSFFGIDYYDGGAGTDTINWGADTVTGATFDLLAGTATDTGASVEAMVNFENLNGTANRDIILGTSGVNVLQGNGGNDDMYGKAGADQLYGGNGLDYLSGGTEADYLSGGADKDVFFGGAGIDILVGGGGDDEFYIGAADLSDIVFESAGGGNDRIFASVSYSLAADSEVETIGTDSNAGIVAINLTGSNQANTVVGNNGSNVLDGRGGSDLIYGLGGIDYFAFSTVPNGGTNADVIADFVSADDLIFLDNPAFVGMAAGFLAASGFLSGAGLISAATAAQRVIHNSTTGDLYYDQDGVGGLASVRFANIGAAAVFNYDFFGI